MASLLLHPGDMWWRPDETAPFVARLHDIGLLRYESVPEETACYPAGPEFLKLLMFLGCSPNVALAPGAGDDIQEPCTVRLLSFATPVLLSAQPLPAARCRHCRAGASLPPAFDFTTRYQCGNCGATGTVADLDWRQGAGCARLFLEVSGIHPHEAVPSDSLLDQLAAFSGGGWRYFFAPALSFPA